MREKERYAIIIKSCIALILLLLVSNPKYEIKYGILKFQVLTATNHEGTHWVRIEQPRESKIIFKWASRINNRISLPSYKSTISYGNNRNM